MVKRAIIFELPLIPSVQDDMRPIGLPPLPLNVTRSDVPFHGPTLAAGWLPFPSVLPLQREISTSQIEISCRWDVVMTT